MGPTARNISVGPYSSKAFGVPKLMGTGEPPSIKFDIGFGTILDHLINPLGK
jgi:hypothetical protein